MKLYLFKILLLIFFLSLLLTMGLIYVIISMRPIEHNTMQCDMSGIFYGVGIFQIIFMTLGSTTIFLNLNKKIRDNYYYSLASFIQVPLAMTFIELIAYKDLRGEGGVLFIPFLCLSILFFFKFRQSEFVRQSDSETRAENKSE